MVMGFAINFLPSTAPHGTEKSEPLGPAFGIQQIVSLQDKQSRCSVIQSRGEIYPAGIDGNNDRLISGSIQSRRHRKIDRINPRLNQNWTCRRDHSLVADPDRNICCDLVKINPGQVETHDTGHTSAAALHDREHRKRFRRMNAIGNVKDLGATAWTDPGRCENVRPSRDQNHSVLNHKSVVIENHGIRCSSRNCRKAGRNNKSDRMSGHRLQPAANAVYRQCNATQLDRQSKTALQRTCCRSRDYRLIETRLQIEYG